MSGLISQILDSMQLLHTKVDNMAFHLLFVEKKLRNLTKERKSLWKKMIVKKKRKETKMRIWMASDSDTKMYATAMRGKERRRRRPRRRLPASIATSMK